MGIARLYQQCAQQGIALVLYAMTIRILSGLEKMGLLWRADLHPAAGDPAILPVLPTVGMFFKKTGC